LEKDDLPRKQETSMLRARALTILTAGLVLSFSGGLRAEAPVLRAAVANAPGWITVYWDSGEGADLILVQREAPEFTWGYEVPTGQHTDMNLQADTVYRYRVCAQEGNDRDCTDWVPVRTQASPPPPVVDARLPPIVTGSEAFREPERIRIWWKKNGSYERVIVRWRTPNGGEWQTDVNSKAFEGSHEIQAPQPGTYVFVLKGCMVNVVGVAKCGDWSKPFEARTAPPGVAQVICKPPTLKAPKFAANGRAEYAFENPPPGYNTVAGTCERPDRGIVADYRVYGSWNPGAQPTNWDRSGANTTETYTLTFGEEFSPERAPRRPLPEGASPTATISFVARAQCDRDPWLNANATCRRTADSVPVDIRAKWPTLLTEPFPHTRNVIPEPQRAQLRMGYNQASGRLVEQARPLVKPGVLAPKPRASKRRILRPEVTGRGEE
jgi:hypothetical protein